MATVKIGPKRRITIPWDIFKKLKLEVGDFLEVQILENGIFMIPEKLVRKDQLWFWTKEWQEKEKEADEAIEKGELSGPFKKAENLIGHLRKQKDED